MSKYREEQITGYKWVRSNKVSISNQYGGVPTITFGEEEITILSDGRTTNLPLIGLSETMSDPTQEFPLVNPITAEELGSSASYQELYVILHSLYIHLAKKRDLEV